MPSRLPKVPFFLTAAFAFIGFLDAAYLTATHYFALPLPCSLTNGCDTVLASRYAMVGPVPLALLGALYYLAALLLAVQLYTTDGRAGWAARLVRAVSGVGVLVSAFLLYVQVSVIGALCMYCLTSAGTSVLLFLSSWFLVRALARRAAQA